MEGRSAPAWTSSVQGAPRSAGEPHATSSCRPHVAAANLASGKREVGAVDLEARWLGTGARDGGGVVEDGDCARGDRGLRWTGMGCAAVATAVVAAGAGGDRRGKEKDGRQGEGIRFYSAFHVSQPSEIDPTVKSDGPNQWPCLSGL